MTGGVKACIHAKMVCGMQVNSKLTLQLMTDNDPTKEQMVMYT